MESKMENHTHVFKEMSLVLQLRKNCEMKVKQKRVHFLQRSFCLKEIFVAFVFNLNV